MQKLKVKQKQYYDRNARDLPRLKCGDTVRVQPIRAGDSIWKRGKIIQVNE